MTDGLLDTTFFIDLYRGDTAALQLWGRIRDGASTGTYSPITVYELWTAKGITRAEEFFYEGIFELLTVAPLTATASIQAGIWIRSITSSIPDSLGRDALIAATAVERNEPVYTRNVRDMQRFTPRTVRY